MIKKINNVWLFPVYSALLCWFAAPGDVGFWAVGFFALVPLFVFLQKLVDEKERPWRIALGGFIYGLLLFLSLLYWIINVLERYGHLPMGIAIAGWVLLSCYMAFYPAFFLFCCRLLAASTSLLLLFFLPSLWVGLDWLRSWVFSGFPWMDLGYFPAFSPWFLQGASLVGHYGLTWLVVFCNVFLWLFCRRQEGKKIVFCAFALLVGYGVFSNASFIELQKQLEEGEHIRAGVVQGNVAQDLKWVPEEQQQTISTYISLSRALAEASSLDFLVWPETALPFFPQRSLLTREVLSLVRETGLPLVCGAPWEQFNTSKKSSEFYNAALLFGLRPETPLSGIIYKAHLVPFGEYIPLSDIFSFPKPLVESAGNLSAGEGTVPLRISSASGRSVAAGVLICFESVFPDLARSWVDKGSEILLNLTNDAWYGKTSAPWHTLAMTVLRAVETRRAIVRSANTGFSAFISPAGQVLQQTEWFAPAAIKMDVPLRAEKTFYVRFGWLFAPFCLFSSMCYLLWYCLLWKKLAATAKA